MNDPISFCLKDLTILISDCLGKGVLPNELKLKNVYSIYKILQNKQKENYRPVSIPSYMFKIFERIQYNQISCHRNLHYFLCDFRKNNSQYSLLRMIKIWKNHLDKRQQISVILTNLPKAFDTMSHSS